MEDRLHVQDYDHNSGNVGRLRLRSKLSLYAATLRNIYEPSETLAISLEVVLDVVGHDA
jgi:hypothetical protein